MSQQTLCFDCAYWQSYLQNREPDTIIVDGAVYKLTRELYRPSVPGVYTLKNIICVQKPHTTEVYVMRGHILRGVIPERFRTALPDQYRSISRDLYVRIVKYEGGLCNNKGCFDRKTCVWFNWVRFGDQREWNEIPENWQEGDEHCPSYINKEEIL